MKYLHELAIAAIILVPFAAVNAEIAESVSTYQLNAAYECSIEGAVCTGTFGNIRILK